MDLQELKEHWNCFGQSDPLWAILTEPSKKNRQWDLDEFFETGRSEIFDALKRASALPFGFGLHPGLEQVRQGGEWRECPQIRKGKALDFGCGVGRLTQAMCLFFEQCHGVDIAPAMIELARQYNRYGSRCIYHLNDQPHLKIFRSSMFDFVYSNIVLQHMETVYSRKYIREMVRVLAPGGMLVFQVPSEPGAGPGTGEVIDYPLPDSAFAARIAVLMVACLAAPGSSLEIPLRIRNAGPCLWPARGVANARYQIHIGNHWLDTSGKMLVFDDIRMPLPKDLAPGEEAEVLFSVRVPGQDGDYLLELDLVQEQVAWFAAKGSKTVRIAIRVQGTGEKKNSRGGCSPRMEMYGLPKDEVVALVQRAGAEVLSVENDLYAPGWKAFRYYATKAPEPRRFSRWRLLGRSSR